MARPRKPTEALKMSGTLQDHPGRYADRANEPKDLEALGRAPTYMTAAQKKIWKELAAKLHPGWAASTDCYIVESAVVLITKLRDGSLTSSGMTQLISALAKLGMTPADRNKVQVVPKKKEESNPFARLMAQDDQEALTQ